MLPVERLFLIILQTSSSYELRNTLLMLLLTHHFVEGEVNDFYKTSWFVEFEALSRMVKVRGSCDKPFKRHPRLKSLLL